MYYNADLLDIPYLNKPNQHRESLGFIDDIMYGVQGPTDKVNTRKLEAMLKEVKKWRIKHGGQFETSKYVLIHFTHNFRQTTTALVKINQVIIEPAEEAKYLGVIFDKTLKFKTHLQHLIKKGTSAAMALSSIAKGNLAINNMPMFQCRRTQVPMQPTGQGHNSHQLPE